MARKYQSNRTLIGSIWVGVYENRATNVRIPELTDDPILQLEIIGEFKM